MPSNLEIAEHLSSCYQAIYAVLGDAAPRLESDAFVVRAHEMSRAFGALALEMRGYLDDEAPGPMPVLEGILESSIALDPSGAMTMYAMAMLVGPRLLVSLLDARAVVANDGPLLALLNHGSEVCVSEIRRVGESARDQVPIDDEVWQAAARDLAATLEAAGKAESMGLSR